MNIKIKKHVDTMFSEVPYSKKAQELKEEIMADMEAAYNDNIASGDTEQEAFRKACDSLGDMTEVIENLIPEKDIIEKIDKYKRFKAGMTAFAVFLYILGVAVVVAFSTIPTLLGMDPSVMSIIGTICLLVMAAFATGLIVFSRMSVPQEVLPYIKKNSKEESEDIDTSTGKGRILKAYLGCHSTVCLIAYFVISFTTHAWYITWVIFLADYALEKALRSFLE